MKPGFNICRKIFGLASVIITLLICITIPKIACGKEQRLAVLPFNLNAEKDLSFLKDGIQSMFISRLSWNDHVRVLGMTETSPAGATVSATNSLYHDIGNRLNADYILKGSVTVAESRLSIDVSVINIKSSQPVGSFSKQNLEMNDVIDGIDLLTQEINEKVFGRKPSVPFSPSDATDARNSIYAHPERLLENLPRKP